MPDQALAEEGINVDQLLADIESPSGDTIVNNAPEAQTAPEPPQWNSTEWEFDYNGKKIAPDSRDKAIQWMSMGHNYSQRVGEWTKKEQTYQSKLDELGQRIKQWDHYNQVDEYAKQNPEWWAQVQEAYKNRSQSGQIDPNIQSLINPLKEELTGVKEFINTIQQKELQQQIEKEDQALESEVESTRKSYPTIDFNAADDSGKPLELRVLEHAKEIGTKSFRAAFRDYCHDHLVEQAKVNGLQKSAKASEINAKKGIIGTSPTPKKVIERAKNIRGSSYDDLAQEAMREIGII